MRNYPRRGVEICERERRQYVSRCAEHERETGEPACQRARQRRAECKRFPHRTILVLEPAAALSFTFQSLLNSQSSPNSIPAYEGDRRHVKGRSEGMRGSAGHMDTMCRSPVHRMEASQVVRWELRKLLSCSRQPSQPRLGLLLQARGGCAGARLF